MPLLPTAVLLACFAQDLVQPGQNPKVVRVNRVELAVNDDVITLAELFNQLRRAQEVRPVSTRKEEDALRTEVAMGRVMQLLQVQAGEDLGRPKEEMEAIVDNWWAHQIETAGGAREYSEDLERDDKDSLTQRQALTEEIYSYTYTQVITGQEPGREGRPYVDLYQRPGTIRKVYDAMVRNGIGLEFIKGQSRSFVLQQLALEARDQEDLEKKYLLAGSLRKRALAGEDFNALVDVYSELTGDRSISTDIGIEALANYGQEVFNWARIAEAEAISPVVPVVDPETGGVRGWRVLRVLEVQEAFAPPFDTLETQQLIQRMLRRQESDRLTSLALQDLLEVAYIHPERQSAEARSEVGRRLEKATGDVGGARTAPDAPSTGGTAPTAEPAPADPAPAEPAPAVPDSDQPAPVDPAADEGAAPAPDPEDPKPGPVPEDGGR